MNVAIVENKIFEVANSIQAERATDLHIGSMNAGMKDMLNVMSKFLNMKMSLEEVILASTWNPARVYQSPGTWPSHSRSRSRPYHFKIKARKLRVCRCSRVENSRYPKVGMRIDPKSRASGMGPKRHLPSRLDHRSRGQT